MTEESFLLLKIDNIYFSDCDLSPDILSEGVEVSKTMEISSLSKNMNEYRVRQKFTCSQREQKKTLKQDISDLLRIMANRKKYFKDNKIKATVEKFSILICNCFELSSK